MTSMLLIMVLCPWLNFLSANRMALPTTSVAPMFLAFEPVQHDGGNGNEDEHGTEGAASTVELTEAEVIAEMQKEIQADNWAESFLFGVVNVGILTITFGLLLSFFRIIRGPQLADRVLGGDTFSLHVVALVILLAIRLRTEVFFDAALVVAIIGFASTLAFAQYIGNRRKSKAVS